MSASRPLPRAVDGQIVRGPTKTIEGIVAELRASNARLEAEMTRRTQVELELRHAQKLESVGRLAAGIAHEINTPLQFVSDSCEFIASAGAELMRIIAAHRRGLEAVAAREQSGVEALATAVAVEAEADLAYLVAEVPKAIDRALGGLSRVTTIVRAMREFASQDSSEQALTDLNRAVVNTITVARNEYKDVADIATDLGDLPHVRCRPGELNQVLLDMVVNAAHAIEDAVRGSDRRGTIAIRTRVVERYAVLEIEDDGCGIPPANLDRIYDPFFTTKEIGRGIGQGLAIARSVIVDKHAGRLEVASELGRGTTFTILLPISGVDASEEGVETA